MRRCKIDLRSLGNFLFNILFPTEFLVNSGKKVYSMHDKSRMERIYMECFPTSIKFRKVKVKCRKFPFV